MPGSLAQGPLACIIFCKAVFRWCSKGCSGAYSAGSCRQGVRGWARCCLECECSRGPCGLESGEEDAISRPCPPTSSRGSEDPLRVRGRSHSLQGWRPAGTRREERLAYVFSCAFSSPPLREGRQRVRLFGDAMAFGRPDRNTPAADVKLKPPGWARRGLWVVVPGNIRPKHCGWTAKDAKYAENTPILQGPRGRIPRGGPKILDDHMPWIW